MPLSKSRASNGPAFFFDANSGFVPWGSMNNSIKSTEGPWSVLYEADGNIHRIGPFDTQADATQAAKDAQAEGEFDIWNQQAYLLGPDHRLIVFSEVDVVGGDEYYDAELAADQILERQELEDFEGFDAFEGSERE